MYHLYRNDQLLMHAEEYLTACTTGEQLQRDRYDRIDIRDDKGRIVARLAHAHDTANSSEWAWKEGLRVVK